MDHRVSKDMISQGMSVTGEKKTEDLGGSQYGSVATPSSLMDAYSSMYKKEVEEDAKWGYDSEGRSLNPKDKKKKVKEDVQNIDEEPISLTLAGLLGAAKAGGAALAAKGAAAAGAAKAGAGALAAKTATAAKAGAGAVKGAATAAKTTAAKSGMTVKKAGQIAHGASLAHEVGDAVTGMGKPKPTSKGGSVGMRQAGTLAAGHELDGEILKELQDAGLFSEEEIKSLTEISADLALKASKGADVARGKLAAAGDKEGAKAKASQASRLYAASGEKRKKEPVAIPDRSYPKGKGANYKE